MSSINGCPPVGTPLRSNDFCPIADNPLPLTGTALSLVGWIILAIIMTILMISICLMALIRYGMSHRRKKLKDQEIEDEQRIVSSAASVYQASVFGRPYAPSAVGVDLDLPAAHTLDDRPNYFM
uniref:Uncharacterized protein n=1 Tax=Panagrolaimus superbus TaxID=310955 RepID=A0A914YNX3_9BILA